MTANQSSNGAAAEPTIGLDPVSLDAATRAAVDRWAAARGLSRAEALGRLVRLGLNSAPDTRSPLAPHPDRAFELAASQIDALIDPDAPVEERDRRIARLTEGPPEFVDARVDLPRRRATDLPQRSPTELPLPTGAELPQRRATDRSTPQD